MHESLKRLAAVALLGCSWAVAAAQTTEYTITDNNASFIHRTLTGTETASATGSADLRNNLPALTDQMFQQWWWFRLAGDTRERALGTQTSFVQNSANEVTMGYSTPQNVNFTLNYRVLGDGANQVTLRVTATVSNNSGAPQTVNLFYYHDLNLAGTTDSSAAVDPGNIITIDSAWRAQSLASPTPLASQVGGFSTIRGLFTNTAVNNLSTTPTTHSGDEGSAFQWALEIPAGETRTVAVSVSIVPVVAPRITDGDAVFDLRELLTQRTTSSSSGNGDFRANATTDQLWRHWWWYRTGTDTREFGLASLTNVAKPAENNAILSYSEPGGADFEIGYTLTDTGDNQAILKADVKVTNRTAAPITVDLFNYSDFDVNGGSSGDVATQLNPRVIEIADGPNRVQYASTEVPFKWQASDLFVNIFDNTAINDLTNAASPFSGSDLAVAYQWRFDLTAGETKTTTLYLTINTDAPIGGGPAIPGDTDASGCVDDADLTNIILDFGGAGGNTSGFAGTDINNDGIVDDADLTDLILNFGSGC